MTELPIGWVGYLCGIFSVLITLVVSEVITHGWRNDR